MSGRFRLFFVAAAILSNAAIAAAQATDNDGWRTVVYPIHAWAPIFGADVSFPEDGGGEGGPSHSVSGRLNGAALSGFRVERRRLSVEGEFIWAGLSGSVDLPRWHLDADVVGFRAMGGFEIAPALYADAGVRRLTVKVSAKLEDDPEMNWEPVLWEPAVGMTYRPKLSRTLRFFSRADFSWGGDHAHRTTSATASIEWQPGWHMVIGGGYGFLYLRADDTVNSRPVRMSQTLHGPQFTIGIAF